MALDSPCLLVCAPAGYGKSLLVGSWLAERRVPQAAWVNLSADDQEASQVWSAITDALAFAASGPVEDLTSIAALAMSASEDVAARLARWMQQQTDDTVLVIDDLHLVTDRVIHEELVELVAAAAGKLHLVVISRHDPPWPLHRMRLDGLLRDLRADNLAFNQAEAADLFELLDVPLRPDQVVDLVTRTQGWAAGLRLAALGAASASDRQQFLGCVSGNSDYISDYLLREVYEGLGVDWRDFLARISVVDEISPELAEALGGGVDSAHRLAGLAGQNAFIHQIGARPGWYRVHPLLLDFLRSRAVDVVSRRTLHQRAARWFQEQGEPLPALAHALAAQDWDLAADLVEVHVVSWTVRRPPEELRRMLNQVSREVVLTHPGLAIGLAAALTMSGEPVDVAELTAAAREQLGNLTGQRRRRYDFMLELIDFGNQRWSSDLDTVLAGCQRMPTEPAVLASFGLADWDAIRTLLINNAGSCELWLGDLRSALAHLTDAGRVDQNRPVLLPTLNAQAHLAYLHWVNGDLNVTDRVGRQAVDGFARLGIATAAQACSAYLALAGAGVDRDELLAAGRWLQLARDAAAEPHTEFAADLIWIRLLAAEGRLIEAVAALRQVRQATVETQLPPWLVTESQVIEIQLFTSAGNGPDAREANGASLSESVTGSAPGTVRAKVDRHIAAVRRAVIHGAEEVALASLESALELAAPELLRQPFLAIGPELRELLHTRIEVGTRYPGFAVDLLDRRAKQSTPRAASGSTAILVPLTDRENNVLRYLATTLTTKEIAEALYVSVNTVKTHQRSIHQKLGARERREAVAHARALGLL